MITTSSGNDGDVESQLILTNFPSDRWRRWNFLILQLQNLIPRGDKAENDSFALDRVSSSTSYYSVVSQDDVDAGQAVSFLISPP